MATPGLPDFYGSNLDDLTADQIAIFHIGDDLFDNEASLQHTRWFDYRFMHPTVATYLFIHQYRQLYKKYVARTRDIRLAKRVTGIKGINIEAMSKANSRAIWRARQAADRLGTPYEFFIRESMQNADKFGWKNLPRPCHLYNAGVVKQVGERWDEELRHTLKIPILDVYRQDHNHPHAVELQDYLMQTIKTLRQHPEFALSNLIYEDRLIPEQRALEAFGESVMRRAKQFSREM